MSKVLETVITTSPQQTFSYGHLIWWTVRQGIRDPKVIQQAAAQHKIPDVIREFLTGAKEKSAWEKATNLRTNNTLDPIEDPVLKTETIYTTRDVDSSTRILVREVMDASQKRLSAVQYGVLSFDNGFKWEPDSKYWREPADLRDEIDQVIGQLETVYYYRVGKVDDAKLRNALLRWLEKRHRVSVRGNGGVYYLPNYASDKKRKEIISEILSIRDWLDTCALGTLTAIEIKESETTTLVDITEAAINEIASDLDAVEESLKKYQESQGMNAGSRMEASRSQVAKMETLLEKVQALEESLGEKVGVMRARTEIVLKRAEAMHRRSSAEVSAFRAAKGKK